MGHSRTDVASAGAVGAWHTCGANGNLLSGGGRTVACTDAFGLQIYDVPQPIIRGALAVSFTHVVRLKVTRNHRHTTQTEGLSATVYLPIRPRASGPIS